MIREKILVVDDEEAIRWTLTESLRGWGYAPVECATAGAAMAAFEANQTAAVLLDINLPDRSGLDVLREIKRRQPEAVVIMITANVLVDETIAALRGGAYDFISKPINLEELQVSIRNSIEAQRLRREVNRIHHSQLKEFSFEQIIGESPVMEETLNLARRVAENEISPVLLQGESGTGKDLLAKAIHYGSRRAATPFVTINCAALPANLVESELFGYEKGAFTDAKARKEGLFEQAEGGTLFLNEIGELELGLQAKLLRVLEDGVFRRVGGLRDIPLDTRVIAASNRNLKEQSKLGQFRPDLFYRLSVIQIDLPPLRERGQDVLLLAEHFIWTLGRGLRRASVEGIAPEVAAAFVRYSWPGNVRELRNVIERALILEDGNHITLKYVARCLAPDAANRVTCAMREDVVGANRAVHLPPDGIALEEVELALVKQAIERSGGNQTRAAKMLRLSRDQLRYRLNKLEHLTN
jgi:DNA-binding NtrC family response regulator